MSQYFTNLLYIYPIERPTHNYRNLTYFHFPILQRHAWILQTISSLMADSTSRMICIISIFTTTTKFSKLLLNHSKRMGRVLIMFIKRFLRYEEVMQMLSNAVQTDLSNICRYLSEKIFLAYIIKYRSFKMWCQNC